MIGFCGGIKERHTANLTGLHCTIIHHHHQKSMPVIRTEHYQQLLKLTSKASSLEVLGTESTESTHSRSSAAAAAAAVDDKRKRMVKAQ